MCAVRQNLKEAQDTMAGASKELNHLHTKCAEREFNRNFKNGATESTAVIGEGDSAFPRVL